MNEWYTQMIWSSLGFFSLYFQELWLSHFIIIESDGYFLELINCLFVQLSKPPKMLQTGWHFYYSCYSCGFRDGTVSLLFV